MNQPRKGDHETVVDTDEGYAKHDRGYLEAGYDRGPVALEIGTNAKVMVGAAYVPFGL